MSLLGLRSTAGAPVPGVRGPVSYVGHLHLAIHPARERGPLGPGPDRTGTPARPVPRVVVSHRLVPTHLQPAGAAGSATEPGSAPTRREVRRAEPQQALRGLAVRRAAGARVPRAGRAPDLVQRQGNELVTRLVRGSRRVEAAARSARVVQDRAPAVGVAGRTAAAVRSERGSDTAAPWRNPAIGPALTTGTAPVTHTTTTGAGAAVDLDRLTDQVVTRLDGRLTAHRERFGRAF